MCTSCGVGVGLHHSELNLATYEPPQIVETSSRYRHCEGVKRQINESVRSVWHFMSISPCFNREYSRLSKLVPLLHVISNLPTAQETASGEHHNGSFICFNNKNQVMGRNRRRSVGKFSHCFGYQYTHEPSVIELLKNTIPPR